MSEYFVASGLLCISSLFIGIMWFQLIKANIGQTKANLLTTKLVLTGFGLVFQSICLFIITLSRSYQSISGVGMDTVVALGMAGVVFSDFLLILAASLNSSRRTYLILYVAVCIVWLAANSIIYTMAKGVW
jgi:hypothetical protein